MKCKQCGLCCQYVTVQIDRPFSKTEWDSIIWYLHHEDVLVYIDDENDWFVEFKTKCRNLDKNNLCKIYKNRPRICRGHKPDDCESTGNPYKEIFRDVDSLKKYLAKKKIDYRFKVNKNSRAPCPEASCRRIFS